MMRLRRASAIVVPSLLVSAATAHAECAWVLWSETEYFDERKVVWKIEEALEKRSECDAASRATRVDAERVYGGSTNKVTYRVKDSYTVWYVKPNEKDQLAWHTKLWCLPSGANPVQSVIRR